MGRDKLLIVLDSPMSTYMPGDVLAGKIIVTLATDTKLRDIMVSVKGESEVMLPDLERTNVWYRVKEVYMSRHITLLGGVGQELLLPAGEHVFHFRKVLPTGIPPSFEGAHGHVRYTVKGRMHRSWRMIEDVEVADFFVLGYVDLNLHPELRAVTKSMISYSASGSDEPLTIVVAVPATGVVPGQSVDVHVDVDNGTNLTVHAVRSSLMQKVLFVTARNTKELEVKVATVKMGSVKAHSSCTWARVLTLPPGLPLSGLPHCSIILVSYRLEVTVQVGPHFYCPVRIPMVVGSEPLRPPPRFSVEISPAIVELPPSDDQQEAR